MKILFSLFCAIALAFFVVGFSGLKTSANAQQPPTVEQTVEQPSPTFEDYESLLEKLTKVSKDFTKLEVWDGIKLKNKVTGKVVEWKELSEFDKHMFCLTMLERATAHFSKVDEFWQLEIKKFNDPNHKLVSIPMPMNDKQKPAKLEDVKKYVEKLTSLRKFFAVEYEMFVEKTFKTYEKEIPKEEREKMTKEIRAFHDKHKLIERK